MTNEEAINYLRGCFAPTCNACPIGCKRAELSQEARQIATQALEKQTHNCRNCRYCFTCLGVEYEKGQSAIAFDGYCWKWESDND